MKERFNDPADSREYAADFNRKILSDKRGHYDSHLGYIKRTNLNEYRLQGRGGVRSQG